MLANSLHTQQIQNNSNLHFKSNLSFQLGLVSTLNISMMLGIRLGFLSLLLPSADQGWIHWVSAQLYKV